MRMALLRMRAAALAALAWGSACGGNVVVDGMPDGSGGAGATSSSANTTGAFGSSAISTGTVAASAVSVGVGGTSGGGSGVGGSSATGMATSGTASASTGAGGGDAWSACMKFCETYTGACELVEPGQCEGFCKGYVNEAPQCNEPLALFFDCATNGSIDCDFVLERCRPFLAAFDACRAGGGCTPLECFADRNRACSCKGSCPNAVFAVECRPDMRSGIACSCFVNGEELARCQDVGPACDLAQGCCEPFFDEFR
ncbi:hypothetical protein WMF27_26060 [Sorangium sp. So ce281]|uniref:hypothetical protein n=1 Tax=unclassified Sorangium TaxID=2621164 RepID=UPI003F62C3A0